MSIAATEPGWSAPVNGLQARVSVSRERTTAAWPFLTTQLELRNVSDVGNMMELALDPAKIAFTVVDASGKLVPIGADDGSRPPYNGVSPTLEPLQLPHDSSLRWNITSHKVGHREGQPPILDLGSDQFWMFPLRGKAPFFLQGRIQIAKVPGSRAWHGTLDLPKVELPLR